MQLCRFILPLGRLRHWRVVVLWCWTVAAAWAAPVKFDLPAQPAATALAEFAKQAGVEVLFSFTDLKNVQSVAVVGVFEVQDAIDQLLRGTGFTAQRNVAGKFVVTRERPPRPALGCVIAGAPARPSGRRRAPRRCHFRARVFL